MWQWSGELEPRQSLEIRNMLGGIAATQGDRLAVRVWSLRSDRATDVSIESWVKDSSASGSGTIAGTLPVKPADFSASTQGGSIRRAVPFGCPVNIEARSSAGRIRSDLPLRLEQTPSRQTGVYIRPEATAKLTLERSSGSIILSRVELP